MQESRIGKSPGANLWGIILDSLRVSGGQAGMVWWPRPYMRGIVRNQQPSPKSFEAKSWLTPKCARWWEMHVGHLAFWHPSSCSSTICFRLFFEVNMPPCWLPGRSSPAVAASRAAGGAAGGPADPAGCGARGDAASSAKGVAILGRSADGALWP